MKYINRKAHEEESYFVSMTDMMVGMLFVFIIMLMAFALNFKEAEEKREKTLESLTKAHEARAKLLESLRSSLLEKGVIVQIDIQSGILRLPESILFDVNKSILSNDAKEKLGYLANALWEVLPCYATTHLIDVDNLKCPAEAVSKLESVFIEGHTDKSGDANYNLRLSVDRSVNTYQEMVFHRHELESLRNNSDEHLLSVSGYGEERTISDVDQDNRRIDLRFLMATPRPEDFDTIERAL